MRLQTLLHRRARLRRDAGLRPERIVDVEAAAALLPEAGNAPFRILGGKSPHAEAAEATRIATAAARAGVLSQPIGAWRMGHLRLSRSVKAFLAHMECPSDDAVDSLSDS